MNIKSGREDWKTPFEGVDLSLLGNGPKRYAVAGFAQEVVRFDLARGRIDERRTIETGGHPLGSPTVVGASLVFGSLDGHLYVYDLDGGELRWAFRAPDGAQVHEFVHSGKRIYVTTSIGLFCIADDTTRAPPSAGFVLEWRGDTTKPSYQPEKR